MKTLKACLLVMSLSVSAAHASYFQIDCGNAAGTVRTGSGHTSNFVEVTERNWNTGAVSVIRDDRGSTMAVEVVTTHPIHEEQGPEVCRDNLMVYWSRSTFAQEVVITKTDGSEFSEYTSSVTPDRKAVKTILICERFVSSMIPCRK